MATIDGIEFNLKSANVKTVHRNVHIPAMNSALNTIDDTGYDGLDIQIVGFENTRDVYDAVLAAFMATGEHSLVVNDGWEYRIHSVVLNQSLPTYIVNNHFPYSLTMRTDSPFAYNLINDYRAKSITSNNQEWAAADHPPGLLLNSSFEEWSNGVSSAPNSWVLYGTGGSVAQHTTPVKVGSYCARVSSSSTGFVYLKQNLYGFEGVKITFGAWVWCHTVARAIINIWTGNMDVSSPYHTGNSTWQWLTTTAIVHEGANVQLRITSGSLIYMLGDGAVLMLGDKIEDNTFALDITTDSIVATPVDVQITSSTAPSSEQATLSQEESY